MQQPVKTILFLSDLTVNMKQVFQHAGALAAAQHAEIIILHVMEEDPAIEKRVRMVFDETIYSNLKSEHKSGARNILIGKNVEAQKIRHAMTGFFGGEDSGQAKQADSLIKKILVAEGRSVASEIIETSLAENCDMIVMGCRPQNLIAEVIGDKLVRKVLKRASIPVLVVPIKEQAAQP